MYEIRAHGEIVSREGQTIVLEWLFEYETAKRMDGPDDGGVIVKRLIMSEKS